MDTYAAELWEQHSPRGAKAALGMRAERQRRRQDAARDTRRAEVARVAEATGGLTRSEIIVAKRIEHDRRMDLAHLHARWLLAAALAARAAVWGRALSEERPAREMDKAARQMQLRFRLHHHRSMARKRLAARAHFRVALPSILLQRMIRQKRVAADLIARQLLDIAHLGVTYSAVRTYLHKIRALQRAVRRHQTKVHSQLNLTMRQA